MTSPPLLDLRNVSVMRGSRVVLRDLTLSIGAREHAAILGPNGCGKSTLIKTITRECYPLARPECVITILGRERWDVFELRKMLGIVTNDLLTMCTREFTATDVVLSGFFSSAGVWPHHHVTEPMRDKALEVLHRLEIERLADRPVEELSSGEAKRVLIARALVHDPAALLLDEPCNSLDVAAQHELREILRKLARDGVGILIVTHHLADIIPEIERVIILRNGSIAADGPKQQVLNAALLGQVFGTAVEVVRRDGYYHLW